MIGGYIALIMAFAAYGTKWHVGLLENNRPILIGHVVLVCSFAAIAVASFLKRVYVRIRKE